LSDFGAYENEMDTIAKLSERELDLLLAGKGPSDNASPEELAAFFSEAADVLLETPGEATSARHLAAIAAAAHAKFSQPSVSPARANREAPSSRPRSKLVFRNPFSSLAAKLALAGVLVLAAFGGTAYAGVLPDPVQGTVSNVADTIGVSLPDGDSNDGAVNDVDDGDVNNVDEGTVGDTNGGDEGIANDGAVNDVVDNDQGDDDQGTAGDDDQGDDDQGAAGDDDQGDDDQGAADQGAVDEGDQGAADQGAVDEGDQGAADQGAADEGGQGDSSGDQDDSGSSGDQGDGGSQSDGDN
jgi:hypothetical protein